MGTRLGVCTLFGSLLSLVLLCGGCANFPPTTTVRLDPSLREGGELPFVEVHVMAIPERDLSKWTQASMTQYWAPNGASRSANSMRRVLQLGPNRPSDVIKSNDPIWNKWGDISKGYLLIFADVNGVANRDMINDPRRVWIPLNREDYNFPKEMTATIRRTGIDVSPRPTAKHKFLGMKVNGEPDDSR